MGPSDTTARGCAGAQDRGKALGVVNVVGLNDRRGVFVWVLNSNFTLHL